MAMDFETIKDLGRKVIGQGPEVEFKNDVKQCEADHGVSFEEAKKVIFRDRMDNFTREMRMTGGIDKKSDGLRNLKAAMSESLDSDTMKFLLEKGADKSALRPLPPLAISPAEHGRAASYFSKKFAGKNPGFGMIDEYARQTKIISELATRFNRDPLLSSPAALETVLTANPDLSADMGRILLSKELLTKIEKSFDKKMKWEQRKDELKNTTKESLKKILWSNPSEYIKTIGRSASKPSFGNFMKAAWATGKFLGKEAWEIAGVAVCGVETIGSGLSFASAQSSAESLR